MSTIAFIFDDDKNNEYVNLIYKYAYYCKTYLKYAVIVIQNSRKIVDLFDDFEVISVTRNHNLQKIIDDNKITYLCHTNKSHSNLKNCIQINFDIILEKNNMIPLLERDTKTNLRKILNIGDDKIVYGCYSEKMNVDWCNELIDDISENFKNIYFVIVGKKNQIIDNKTNIIYLNNDANRYNFIQLCDCLLYFSENENEIGLYISEFMFYKKFIIIFNSKSCQKIINYMGNNCSKFDNKIELATILLGKHNCNISINNYYSSKNTMIDFKINILRDLLVSGEEFYKLCKWSICPRYEKRCYFISDQIKENDFVFLNLDYFGTLMELLLKQKPKHKFNLVTHNSDLTFDDEKYNLIKKYVNKIYAINCSINNENVIKIPIGFVDTAHKPHDKLLEISELNMSKTINVYMNFAIYTNPKERQQCFDILKNKEYITKESNLQYEEFYKQIKRSRYVISPDGTGFDCHRVYEAIMLNAIPIIKKNVLNDFYEKIPVYVIEKWEEINEQTLENNYQKFYDNLIKWKNDHPKWTTAEFWLTF